LPHSEMKVLVMWPKKAMLAWKNKTHLDGVNSDPKVFER
jgi:hypothetical protein